MGILALYTRKDKEVLLTPYYKRFLGALLLCSAVLTVMLVMVPFDSLLFGSWLVAGIAVAVFALTWALFGSEPVRPREKSSILLIVFALCLGWLVLQYLAGIWLGFLELHLPEGHLTFTIAPYLVVMVFSEYARQNLVKKADKNPWAWVAVYLVISLITVLYIRSSYLLNSNLKLTEFMFISVLPWLTQSVFLMFLAYRGGIASQLTFRVLTELPLLVLPLLPNLGPYLEGCTALLFPGICFWLLYRITRERKKPDRHYRTPRWLRAVYYGGFTVLIGGVIALASGHFTYYPLTVASGSMAPNINIGDFVIVKKLSRDQVKQLEAGNVLVFNKSGRTIVHRIIEVSSGDTAEPSFITKGDANREPDNWVVEAGDVIGVTGLRMPLIGYPTLWVHDLTGGGG